MVGKINIIPHMALEVIPDISSVSLEEDFLQGTCGLSKSDELALAEAGVTLKRIRQLHQFGLLQQVCADVVGYATAARIKGIMDMDSFGGQSDRYTDWLYAATLCLCRLPATAKVLCEKGGDGLCLLDHMRPIGQKAIAEADNAFGLNNTDHKRTHSPRDRKGPELTELEKFVLVQRFKLGKKRSEIALEFDSSSSTIQKAENSLYYKMKYPAIKNQLLAIVFDEDYSGAFASH